MRTLSSDKQKLSADSRSHSSPSILFHGGDGEQNKFYTREIKLRNNGKLFRSRFSWQICNKTKTSENSLICTRYGYLKVYKQIRQLEETLLKYILYREVLSPFLFLPPSGKVIILSDVTQQAQ